MLVDASTTRPTPDKRGNDVASLPLVSIGLPTYNSGSLVGQLLDSVVAQDYPNIEVVIADDCSSDNTAEVCRRYAEKYPFIAFHQNPANLGRVGNFLNALGKCSGEFVIWGDHDDQYAPTFISELVAALLARPGAVGAQGVIETRDNSGNLQRLVRLEGASSPNNQTPWQLAASLVRAHRARLRVKNNLLIHGVLRRSALLETIRAYPGLCVSERFWLAQMALAGPFVYVDKLLYFRTKVPTQGRYDNEATDPFHKRTFGPLQTYLIAMQLGVSIARSRIVPLRRKPYAVLLPATYLWDVWMGSASRQLNRLRQGLPDPLVRRLRRVKQRLSR